MKFIRYVEYACVLRLSVCVCHFRLRKAYVLLCYEPLCLIQIDLIWYVQDEGLQGQAAYIVIRKKESARGLF